MVTLDTISTQEDMETWFHQLANPNNPMIHAGALALIKPKLYACDLAKKEASFTFLVEDWQLHPSGTWHTGLVTTAFDTAFGLLCHCFAKDHVICTVNLSIAFLQSIPADKKVVFRVYALSTGRTIATFRGEAYLADDPSVQFATADTTFMILQKKFQTPM